MKRNAEIDFYTDLLIAETLIGEGLSKTAQGGIVNSLIDRVKQYFSNNVNENDPVGSFLDIIAPGAIAGVFSALGFRWLGLLIGLAMRVFHIDVKGILSTIWDRLRSELSTSGKTTSAKVNQIVTDAVQQHTQPATQEEAEEAGVQQDQQQPADDHVSVAMQLRHAKLFRMAMETYRPAFMKGAAPPGWFSAFSQRKATHSNLLGKVLSIFFRVAIASAGLMVAGDAINAFLGRPSAFTGTMQHGKPVEETSMPVAQLPTSKQTTLKLNPSYQPETHSSPWTVDIPNNPSSIAAMLVQFAKDVYAGLDGHEADIQSSPAFQGVVDNIAWYNHTAAGGPIVYIPHVFPSKKALVDTFIDDVAAKIG